MAVRTQAARTSGFNYPMVRSAFPEAHGAREETTRHVVTLHLAAMLAAARRRRGWSQREAARETGVAYGMIGHLEHCRRAPSAALAEAIVTAYELGPAEAALLLAEAVEGAGRDSPFRRTAAARRAAFHESRA
jgi:ribosome-binding protein aMBF1 (putative translation factor)